MNLKGFFIGQDQALNCLVRLSDGDGHPDEMLSARAYRLREQHPWLMRLIDGLFFWDKYHCQECYGIELARLQFPEEYRKNKTGKDF